MANKQKTSETTNVRTLAHCEGCGGHAAVPFVCHSWQRRTTKREGGLVWTQYEGICEHEMAICWRCFHQYYRTTYIAFGTLMCMVVACITARLAIPERLGGETLLTILAIVFAIPAVLFGKWTMDANGDKAGTYYAKPKLVEQGAAGVASGKAPQ